MPYGTGQVALEGGTRAAQVLASVAGCWLAIAGDLGQRRGPALLHLA